jgi:hypothetical protein
MEWLEMSWFIQVTFCFWGGKFRRLRWTGRNLERKNILLRKLLEQFTRYSRIQVVDLANVYILLYVPIYFLRALYEKFNKA